MFRSIWLGIFRPFVAFVSRCRSTSTKTHTWVKCRQGVPSVIVIGASLLRDHLFIISRSTARVAPTSAARYKSCIGSSAGRRKVLWIVLVHVQLPLVDLAQRQAVESPSNTPSILQDCYISPARCPLLRPPRTTKTTRSLATNLTAELNQQSTYRTRRD